jgi:hypothetical protein
MASTGAQASYSGDGAQRQGAPRATFTHILQGVFAIVILGVLGYALSSLFEYPEDYVDAMGLNLAVVWLHSLFQIHKSVRILVPSGL